MASAMPVLPLVGSMIVVLPGAIRPSRSAASIMARPMRSLTLPPGLNDSSLPSTSAPVSSEMRLRRTSGVRPINSVMLPALFMRSPCAAAGAPAPAVVSDVVHGGVTSQRLLARQQVADGGAAEDPLEGLPSLNPHRRGPAPVDLLAETLRTLRRREHPVEHGHDLEDGDVVRRARQRVAAGGASPAPHHAGAPQGGEHLLQELQRHVATVGDVAQAHGLAGLRLIVARQLDEGAHRVAA